MTDIQPPLDKPTAMQMDAYADWTEKELLVAQTVRVNAIAGMLMQISQQVPQVMGSNMMKMAMKLLIKPDKSNE